MNIAYKTVRKVHHLWQRSNVLAAAVIFSISAFAFATLLTTDSLALQLAAVAILLIATCLATVISTVNAILKRIVSKLHFGDYESLYQDSFERQNGPQSLEQLQSYIAELNERYELLTTNIAASIIIQRASGEILFCSPYTQVLTGFSAEEVIALTPNDFLSTLIIEEDQQRYARAKQVAAIGEDILVRIRINHRSAISLWLEVRLIPICNTAGEAVAIMTVASDVTDSLNYQKLIEQQNQDLNDFSYMISHDLKSPIFTIKGMATALKEDYEEVLGEQGNATLAFIRSAADRLEQLVSSLLEYSSLSMAEDEADLVNLQQVLDAVLSDCHQMILESGASVELTNQLPLVSGSGLRIYQVFSNLISNAIKYREPSRALTIAISSISSSASYVSIAIKDNGRGIPASKLDSIFRPFHRAHGADIEGSGIGLACVKKIIDKAGGAITVESREGEGSTFVFSLPLPRPQPQFIPKDLERAYNHRK